jgi:hypothetical protein
LKAAGSSTSGDDIAAKRAQANASLDVARATSAQAKADEAVVTTLQQARAAQVAYAQANGFAAEQVAEVTKKLDEKIAKATADAEKSREAAAAARAEAEARQLTSDTLRDNSARLAEYSLRLQETSQNLDRVRLQYVDGKASIEQLQAATLEASKAQRLFRDAVADTEAAMKRRLDLAKADYDVTKAGLQVKLEEAKATERNAQILGQEGAQRQAGVRVREIELQIRRAGISAQQQEADEVIRVTTEQIRELETKKLLTPEIRAELELRVRSAEAKKLDAQAGEVAAKVTEKEIDLLKRNSVALDQNTSSRERNTKSKLDQNGLDAQGRNADGLRPSTSPDSLSPSLDTRNNNRLVSPELTYDKDKFATNPDGSRITGGTNLPKPPGDGWDWVAELNQGWPYGGYWKRGSEIYSGTPGNSPVNRDGLFNRPFGGFGLLTANPGSGTFRFDGSPEPYQSQALGSGFRPATPASTTPPIPAASAPTAQTSNHTVTINIGGRPTTINTATAGDADALVSLLTQLEDAAGRGG